MAKKIEVMLETGDSVRVTQTQYWDVRSDFQKEVMPASFMRVGDFHLCVGRYRLAVYVEATPNVPTGYATVWKIAEHQESFMRDRLFSQFPAIEAALDEYPTHPMAEDIRQAMKTERDEWAARFPGFDMKPRAKKTPDESV